METGAAPTQEDVRGRLLQLIAPMVVALLFIGSTNVVDAIFVGRLGSEALAAFGFVGPVIGAIFQIQVALGVGVTSVVARATGAGERSSVQRLATHAGVVGLLVAIALSAALALGEQHLFRALGAHPEQLVLIEQFMSAWLLGTPLYFIVIWGTAALRGIGNAKASAVAFMIQAAVNWVAVPLFTFGAGPLPAYGIRGAAIGTVVGYACACVYALRAVCRGSELLAFRTLSSSLWPSASALLAVALPAALSYVLAPATSAVVTALLAERGGAAVASYTVVARVF